MKPAPALSYIMTTKNKLPYLRNSLEKLIEHKKEDEEILVADGDSSDGSREYLADLLKKGKIDQMISESDYGESHALNKLLLRSTGELIKIITDDDVFDYDIIAACRKFMLAHPLVDILSTEGGVLHKKSLIGDISQLVRPLDYIENYKRWQEKHIPFSFCGLGFIMRRSSLPLIGFFNLSFRNADTEFSFRTTAGPAVLAWYTGYSFVNISNPQSVSLVYQKKIKRDLERLKKFYLDENPPFLVVEKLKVLRMKLRAVSNNSVPREDFLAEWPERIRVAKEWLHNKNAGTKEFFL